ncbi:MAG: hypothetical protein AB1634_05080 [Thermodesulfobacteriota bacterium]
MLREWLLSLLTPCPRHLRAMGFVGEQIAIDSRLDRNRAAWQSHLAASRAAVLEAAALCPGSGTAFLLGAGGGHDLPVAELAGRCRQLVLVDLVIQPWHRRRLRRLAPNLAWLALDLSGALADLWQAGPTIPDQTAIDLFAAAQPPALPGLGDEDLVVSVSLASQLGSVPSTWLARGGRRGPGFSLALRRAAARRHVRWLQGLPGTRCLIADQAHLVLDHQGREISRETVLDGDLAGPALRTWRWDLAPIPEWEADRALANQVGVWIWPAGVVVPGRSGA